MLGGGAQVGQSCVLLKLGSRYNLLLDCGVHIGARNTQSQLPLFSVLLKQAQSNKQSISEFLDAVLVSHWYSIAL